MKRLKLAIWIAAIAVVHIAVNRYVNILNAVPDIFLAFSVAYAVFERDFPYAAGAAAVCGLISCALTENGFVLNMLIFILGAAITHEGEKHLKTMPKVVKPLLFTAVISAVGYTVLYLSEAAAFKTDAYLSYAVPGTIMNTIYAVIIYPIIKKTIRLDKIHSSLLIP